MNIINRNENNELLQSFLSKVKATMHCVVLYCTPFSVSEIFFTFFKQQTNKQKNNNKCEDRVLDIKKQQQTLFFPLMDKRRLHCILLSITSSIHHLICIVS